MSMTAERVSVSAFVDPADRDRLLELAQSHERSLSGELRLAIREHLQESRSSERSSVHGEAGRGA